LEFLKVRDLPVLRELSVLQAVELKRLEADVIARRFDIPEFVYCVPETLFMTATWSATSLPP
jgi:hypothetical protein